MRVEKFESNDISHELGCDYLSFFFFIKIEKRETMIVRLVEQQAR